MPTVKIPMEFGHAILTHQEGWTPGGPPPADRSDYLGWHAWAKIQHKAGLRKRECGSCHKWKYPQEMSDRESVTTLYRDKRMTKPVKVVALICKACDAKVKE